MGIWIAAAILSLPDVLAVLRARREDIPAVMQARRYKGELAVRGLVITAAVAVAVVISGGAIAYASIPDSGGVIHGCYTVKGGALRVIDTAKGQTCATGQHGLNWNQTGPKGAAGPPGPAGVSGYGVALCTVAEDGTTGNFFVASSSGGTCSVTGTYNSGGHALLVCPTGDKAISGSSATSADNGTLVAIDAMPNADDTGYQYTAFDNYGAHPISASTDIAVTCANAS
jgi:hypothetical protein